MAEADFCGCCRVRVIKWAESGAGVDVAFETVCLKDGTVRTDDARVEDTLGKTRDEIAAAAWAQIRETLCAWCDGKVGQQQPDPVGSRFDPETQSLV